VSDIERRLAAIRRSECGRKKRYPSEAEARATADHQARASGRELSVYECPWCRGWHLSSQRAASPGD
jgi:hypothetical protein